VSQTGVVIDTHGIVISSAANDQRFLSIAFDGTNYLVVWLDTRNNGNVDVYGARITQDGIVLDTIGIAISSGPPYQGCPSVVFDGINYFVVWQYWYANDTSDIYGTRVNQDGVIIDTNGILISIGTDWRGRPSVAFDGTNYLVVWQGYPWADTSDIHGARVNQNGIVLDTNGFAISLATHDQFYPSVSFDGTDYLVVWEDYRSVYNSDIYGARVNSLGVVIDSFIVSAQPRNQYSPALAHGVGNQVLITYSGWAGVFLGKRYETMRIWGKFYPFTPGIVEENLNVKMQSAKVLEVYPNPAKSVIRVRYPWSAEEQIDIKIFDVSGKLVKVEEKVTSAHEHKEEIKISLKGIKPGIYFLRLGKETKKFLVVK